MGLHGFIRAEVTLVLNLVNLVLIPNLPTHQRRWFSQNPNKPVTEPQPKHMYDYSYNRFLGSIWIRFPNRSRMDGINNFYGRCGHINVMLARL